MSGSKKLLWATVIIAAAVLYVLMSDGTESLTRVTGGLLDGPGRLVSFEEYCKKSATDTLVSAHNDRVPLCPIFHGNSAVRGWDCVRANVSTRPQVKPRFAYDTSTLKDVVRAALEKMMMERRQILFVGDSLSFQMHHMALCLQEFAGMAMSENGTDVFLFRRSNYLHHLPQHIELHSAPFKKEELEDTSWIQFVEDNPRVKYVVLNTGAWWHRNRLRRKKQGLPTQDILAAFKTHFSPKGSLFRSLRRFQTVLNKTVVWRDLAPGGVCDLKKRSLVYSKHNKQYSMYVQLNSIAHSAMKKLGGKVVPNIWEGSLPFWSDHPSIIGEKDVLHWCNYELHSVPALWNRELFQLLLSVED